MVNERIQLIYGIYEGGVSFDEAIIKLTGIKPGKYDRIAARKLIGDYLGLNVAPKENIHPVFLLSGPQVNQLINHLVSEVGGRKIDLYPDGPSVW